MKRHCMTRRIGRQLEDFILEHKEGIEQGKWTMESFLKMAKLSLGDEFQEVTIGNLKGACETVGVKCWNPGKRRVICDVELEVVVEMLTKVMKDLGIEPTPEFKELSYRTNGRKV